MILQGVFQDDRNKPIVSAEHIAELERRHAEGLDAELPKPEPGFFDGIGEAWKGLPAGALKSASLATEIGANSGWVNVDRERLEQEGGYVENAEKYQKQLSERMEAEAKEYRELANGKFGIDSETVGMAGQILYGLAETLPKAVAATVLAGPYGGAALFGMDYGGNEYLKLRDEGVDKTTAGISATVSGLSGGVGVLLPATFGQTRVASATIGALANMGLTGAELGTVGYVLQSQGYDKLSEQYGLNATSIITSGVFGAAFGAGMWRPRGRTAEPQAKQYFDETQRKSVEDSLFDQLKAVGGSYEDETVARTQARLHAVGIENLAKSYGLSHEETMNIVPNIVKNDGSLNVEELNQIIGERGVRNLDQTEENWTRTNNLMTAKQMFFDGKDAKTVRLATGWERGADGKWRYEIPYIQLKEDAFRVIEEAKQAQDAEEDLLWQRNDLSDDEFIAGVQSIAKKYEDTTLVTKLEDVVEAPELFAAYPQLKGLTVEFGHLPKGTVGYYASGSNTIRLSRDANILKNSTRSTLAHEIQHAIQEIEGFAKGASPEIMISKDAALWRDMVRLRELRSSDVWKQYKKLSDEYFDLGANDPLTWAEIERLSKSSDVIGVNKEIDRLHQKWGNDDLIRDAIGNDYWEPGDPFAKQIAEDDPFFAIQQYMKVAGEVEARNVQKRLYMSDAERQSTTLEGTEDRPRSEQIVLLRDALYRQMMYPPIEVEPKFELITISKDSNGVEHKVWGVNGNPDLTVLPNVEGIKPLPLRLQESTLKSGHIDKHLPDLRKAGYESIEQAIWDISQNYTAIYKGKKEGQLILSRPILVESDGRLRKGILYTEFQEVSGSYRIGSVVATNNVDYLKNRKLLLETTLPIRLHQEDSMRTRGLTGQEQPSTEISIAQTESSVNAFVPDDNLIESAKKNFGITNDVREAFYILPDGTMLDGSGRHWGGDERDVAGTRQVDHADIAEVLDSSGAKAMYEFMGKTGAMRFDANARIASIARKPTERQLAVLNRTFRGDYSALSFNTPEGRIVDDIEFESTTPSKVRSFFDEAQAKADNGVAGAFAQKEKGDIRGSFNPTLNQIKLTPNTNLSTFSHEMGHWYLDTMFKLSSKGNEPLNKDVAILLREFGVKSLDDWNALGLDGQRKYHEQFASWLEVYLSKGEAPNPTLKEVLARVAQWIVDVYESFGGTKKAVGERFESEFGTQLPEMSDEVKTVMDRLFAEHKANQKVSKAKPTSEQTSAARVVLASTAQTSRLQKLMNKDPKKLTAKDARDLQAVLRGGDVAAQQLSQGQTVDVAKNFPDAEVDTNVVKETRGNFAREYLMGGDDSQAVVLQNRDRDTVASVAQMNRIAAKPDYYLASTSRSLQDGAPIVSFGSLPDNEHLGIGDVVVASGGRRVPVQYAVVEADSILTSNDYLGNANASYGDPSQINAIAGNGRVTGIREGYNRGTAEQYKADMIADQSHGIKPEVIEKMEKPILVRFVSKEDVTSKLIDDSNRQSTLARSPVEQAVDDAKLISKNVDQYRFDDDGLPTEATVRQFVNDIGDPNVLGRLLTPNGSITPEAVTRVQNAVVQAAYGDLNFTQLFAMETRPGAKRLMNALVAVAPKFVEIRNALGDSYDFSTQLLEGFKQVRESILAGQDSVIQSGSIFGDNGVSPFVDLLDRNRNSMAGVMRELNPIFDAIDQVRAQGGGFFEEAPMDFADILANVRRVQNEALLNEGKPLLMDIDPNEIRQGMALARQAFEEMKAEETVAPVKEELVDTVQTTEEQPVNPVEKSRALLTEDADAIRIDELQEELGDMTFSVEGENGQMFDLSIDEIKALNEAELATADTESASLGEVFACVDLNRGI